jgi:hypothetical protein
MYTCDSQCSKIVEYKIKFPLAVTKTGVFFNAYGKVLLVEGS